MTITTKPPLEQPLRRAAVRATLAPSVHNTQPWRFVVTRDAIEIYADRERQLPVLDPTGRQLLISCGCAVFNARVAVDAAGYRTRVDRFPDPFAPDLVARVTIVGERAADPDTVTDGYDAVGPVTPAIGALDPVIDLRRTNRRRFASDEVPGDFVELLVRSAAAEHAILSPITRDEDRLATAMLSQRADSTQNANPAYRAELRAWTTDDILREDGVPAFAVPHTGAESHDDIPVRDFDTRGDGSLPADTSSSMSQCLLLLGCESDVRSDWVQAGEALERVLLEVARHGYAASPLTQVVEVPFTRQQLRHDLRLAMFPLVLLRVGRAPYTPRPRRRRLVDMLTVSDGS